MEKIGVKPTREARGIVDATGKRSADRTDVKISLKPFLGISQQKALAEIVQGGALAQTVIGGGHRPARYSRDEVDAIKHRGGRAAHRGVLHFGQHAERERRSPSPAARKRQADQVVILLRPLFEIEVNLAGQANIAAGLVDRVVLNRCAAEQCGAKCNDEKRGTHAFTNTGQLWAISILNPPLGCQVATRDTAFVRRQTAI